MFNKEIICDKNHVVILMHFLTFEMPAHFIDNKNSNTIQKKKNHHVNIIFGVPSNCTKM